FCSVRSDIRSLRSFPTRRSSDLLAIFDTVKDELYITAPVYVRAGVTARQAYEAAEARIDEAVARLNQSLPAAPALPDLETLAVRSEEHTSELQSRENLVCRLLLE